MKESEEVLAELQRQSSLLETIEKKQSETNGHLRVIGTLIVIVASAMALMHIFSTSS